MKFAPAPELVKELKRIIRKDLPFPVGWTEKALRQGNMVIYINRKDGLIVKAPMCIIGKETEGITLPTIHLDYGWVLQPLCTFENRKEAAHEVARRIGTAGIKSVEYDFDITNVGRWNGVPYLFDW